MKGTSNGNIDIWVVKVNGVGEIQWQRLIGGTGADGGISLAVADDGGYVILGEMGKAPDGNLTGTYKGGRDLWVAKLDGTGGIQWQEILGGSGNEYGRSIEPTPGGGYAVLAESSSLRSGDVTGTNNGLVDLWALQMNGTGGIQWQALLGGIGLERGRSLQPTGDGGYVLLGDTPSNRTGNVTGLNHGGQDIWVVKLAGAPPIVTMPGGTATPTDTNADGLYDDVNGNDRRDFADVVLYFNQMTWIAANEPVSAFDCNGNGRIDFADVVWLFNHL